ncbi:MAG: DUF2201 family putative metallopeptidase [Desulfatibacillaceae bacterium]
MAAEAWDAALRGLWRQSRFTSYFYQFADLVPEPAVPTMGLFVSGNRFRLLYNPEFVEALDTDHLIGLLVHEMLHVVLDHGHRSLPGQDAALRNLAQDMVINTYLLAHARTFFSRKGFQDNPHLVLPPGLPVIPESFGRTAGRGNILDVPWEKLYAWLAERVRKAEETGEEPEFVDEAGADALPWQGTGNQDASPAEGLVFTNRQGKTLPTGVHLFSDSSANDQADAGRKRVLRFIRDTGQVQGERIATDLAALIREPAAARVSWKSRIRGIVDRHSMSIRWDVSWSRLNRRYFDAGIYAPGRAYRQHPIVTVAVDVSGSMAAMPARLETAFGVVEELIGQYRVNLLCMDQDLFVPSRKGDDARPADQARPFFYQKGDWRRIKSGSRGATFFAPLFNRYMQGRREALVVMTDGYVYDLEYLSPHTPTIWVVPEERVRDFRPPFGIAVPMEEKQ